MARRVALASALVSRPELLVPDEPTSGLDPIGTREVKELVMSLASQGVTVLMTSHLLGDTEDICSKIAILSKGRVAAFGKTGDLLIVMAWAQVPVEKAEQFKPKVIVLGEGNKIVSQASSITWRE